jgi:hypothetical protein
MRTNQQGFLLKEDVPLRFCSFCSSFNHRAKKCESYSNGPYTCCWTVPMAFKFAADLVGVGKIKVNLIAEALKKSG